MGVCHGGTCTETGQNASGGLLWCGHTGIGMGTYAQGGAVHPTQHRTSLLTTYYQWHRVVGQVVR